MSDSHPRRRHRRRRRVFYFAALWLLQCHEYPRAAFDVNIRGTFNVLEACIAAGVERLVYSSSDQSTVTRSRGR